MSKRNILSYLIFLVAGTVAAAETGDLSNLARAFATPPASARPWVYWFWVNSSVTREGITADLEAMKRVGIGGVLLMDVNQGVPPGKIQYMDAQWQEMFAYSVREARRLGLQINFNDGSGWNGSGGPWIPPELAMQRVYSSEVHVDGGESGVPWEGVLPLPKQNTEYRDIAVFAIPEREFDPKQRYQLSDYETKTLSWGVASPYRHLNRDPEAVAPAGQCIPLDKIVDLTDRMQPDGSLSCDVPPGEWTLLRMGHAWTGRTVQPTLADQTGPECDRLSKAAMDLHFQSYVKRLMNLVGPAARGTLVATHIDSWEAGGQNWTAAMRDEFRKRRGYDPLPYLPVLAGRILGDPQLTERFLYDLRRTVSELMIENYTAEFQRLAHQVGLRNSFESYTTGGDDLDNADFVDEPMAEFWTPDGGGLWSSLKSMSSVAHLNGQTIVGAEAFTSNDRERWLLHPATIKGLGDDAFCHGINRFVIHRYPAQPFGPNIKPGVQMGPWGLHYDRNNTWWEWSQPWHEYLARCQYLLRKGAFVADVLKLESEEPMDRFEPITLAGYAYDACGPATFAQTSVRDGRVVFPSGASYRLVILPDSPYMSVEQLTRIRDLVESGAAILGKPPRQTPGLKDWQEGDVKLQQLVKEIWGEDASVTDRALGLGRVFSGIQPGEALARLGVTPAFASDRPLHWIQRAVGKADLYFVASQAEYPVDARCTFRVHGKQPELWDPETGTTRPIAVCQSEGDVTRIPLHFEPAGSLFVVFHKSGSFTHALSVTRDGEPVVPAPGFKVQIQVLKATYGVPGDAVRTRDMKAKVQALLDAGTLKFRVARMAEGDDPAYGIVKRLTVECTADGRTHTLSATDPEEISFAKLVSYDEPAATLRRHRGGTLVLEARKPGNYEIHFASGRTRNVIFDAVPAPVVLDGPWQLAFPPDLGAPTNVAFDHLMSWTDSPDDGVKYFSGTATYRKQFTLSADQLNGDRRLWLDLGKVQVMARVRLNGRDLGILWKRPYCVNISSTARAGENVLEIEVVNLLVNRMIGDEHLPDHTERNGDGSLKVWPKWLLDGKPIPDGRYTFTTWKLWKKDDPLQESGLLGPVSLKTTRYIEL